MPANANSFFGFYRALVIDTKDPQFMGRVKVRIPDLMVDPVNTGNYCEDGIWAHPANNYLGGRNINDNTATRCDYSDAQYQGSCLIPPMGSHVFIFFEKGDPNRPYYFSSAEYGETIVPPENRVGVDYDKKWTLLKTHEGRTIIVSDDSEDCRVEITGKKRLMNNPPFGDIDSVFKIDDNQTVFLIDEREENEKVFLKDYRGNYIKMIQNEMSQVHGKVLNDQLHIYMHDDIHIDTPKNIYITAGENIHIRAGNDIYIHALHDMFIKAKNELKEMAHKIDRYSETSDNRHADTDINDHASNVINRQGANEINDISIKCVRNAMSMIADVSGGKVTIQSGSMTNISSGGTIMIMGSQTFTQTSMAPESVSPTCKIADMTPDSTPAKPDKERYQEPVDNPTDYPKEYVGNVNNPWSFNSKISNESQPYNTVVGGISMPPYSPPKSAITDKLQEAKEIITTKTKIQLPISETTLSSVISGVTSKITSAQSQTLLSESSKILKMDISQTKKKTLLSELINKVGDKLTSIEKQSLLSSIIGSVGKKAKSLKDIIKDSVSESYEKVRKKDVAVKSYQSKITRIMSKVYSVVEKQVENIKKLSSKVGGWLKKFFTSTVPKINKVVVSLIKKDWTDFAKEENDDTNSESTLSIAKGFFDRFKSTIKSSISESKEKWKKYISKSGELDTELSAYEDDIINNDLYNELSKEKYTKESAFNKIKSILSSGFSKVKESSGGWFSKIKNKITEVTKSVKDSFNESKFKQTATSIISTIKQYAKKILDKIFGDDVDEYYSNEIKEESDDLKITIENDCKDIEQESPNLVSNTINSLDFSNETSRLKEKFNELFNSSVSEFSGELQTINDNFEKSVSATIDGYSINTLVTDANKKDEEFSELVSENIDSYLNDCINLTENSQFLEEYNNLWANGKTPTVSEITNLVLKYTSNTRNDLVNRLQSTSSEIPSLNQIDKDVEELEKILIGEKGSSKEGTLFGESLISYEQASKDIQQLNSLLTMSDSLDDYSKTFCDESLKKLDEILETGSNSDSDIESMLSSVGVDDDLKQLESIICADSEVDATEDSSAIGSVLNYITDTIKAPADYLNNMSPSQPSTIVNNTLNSIPSLNNMASSVSNSMGEFVTSADCYSTASNYLSSYNFNNLSNNVFSTVQDYCGVGESGASSFTESVCSAIKSPVTGLSNAISSTSNFLSGVKNRLTLTTNPLNFVNELANGPSQFQNQLSSNINSMLNRCKNTVKGMSPLSDALVLVDTLRSTISQANNCVYNFKNGILSNLRDIISAPINLKNQFNSYLQNAVNLINGMPTGDDVIDRIKENAGFSFMNSLRDLLNPLTTLSNIQDSLSSSINNLFSGYDPFSGWNTSTESTLDIIKSLFEDEEEDHIYNTVINNSTIQDSINDIWETIKDKNSEDLTQEDIDNITNKIDDIIEKEQEILEDENTIKDSIIDPETGNVKDNIISGVEDSIKDIYPNEDSLTEEIGDKLDDIYNEVIEDQKDVIDGSIILDDNQIDDEFSKYNPIKKLYSVPNFCGVGYEYLLFMKRKYINTIPVLVSRCGSQFLSFSLIRDIDIIKNSDQFKLMDSDTINDFNNIVSNYKSNKKVQRNTVWWNNLDYILKQCEIYSIDLFITIFDFKEKNLFGDNYVTDDWDAKYQNFIKDICEFVNYRIDSSGNVVYENNEPQKRYCHCILNFGYGSYTNPDDPNNQKHPIYPTCGYLRNMIMYMVYDCDFTSNMMALTANESDNIYYYNPYSEWKSYDDNIQHQLTDYEITARDTIDDLKNGSARSVVYDENSKVVGGYCNFLINCSKKSLPIMSMYDFSDIMKQLNYTNSSNDEKITVEEYYTQNGEIHPNIMNDIFNKSARKCIKYFKTNDYFDTNLYVKFDSDGEVAE